jgi:hypothetical protein
VTKPVEAIPAAVRALLRFRWQPPETEPYFVETQNQRLRDPDPPFMKYKPDSDAAACGELYAFHYADARQLAAYLAKDGLAAIDGDYIQIHAEAEIAVDQFCREAYAAWIRCRAVLDRAMLHSPIPPERS